MNEEEMLKIFGENVRKQREKENLTLKDVAEKTKIREQYLQKIENGNAAGIRCSHIFIIAHALNIKAYKLCKGLH